MLDEVSHKSTIEGFYPDTPKMSLERLVQERESWILTKFKTI